MTKSPLSKVVELADKTRKRYKGDHVHVRALIEFSNICHRNCLYCGLRMGGGNTVTRYRMEAKEIVRVAREAAKVGADTIVLQSGEGAVEADWLAALVRELSRDPGLPITLSVGEHGHEEYALWKKAGASRYLLRHETSDPELYERLHPGYSLEERLRCLHMLKEIGYECGGGFMTGLPGQSVESIARDLSLCESFKLDMVGIGPFLPQALTPLAQEQAGDQELTLRALAVTRLLLPHANLPATTALASLDRQKGQILGLQAGANVLMPNFTPASYKALYSIYDHKKQVSVENSIKDIEAAGRHHSLVPNNWAEKSDSTFYGVN